MIRFFFLNFTLDTLYVKKHMYVWLIDFLLFGLPNIGYMVRNLMNPAKSAY